MPGIEFETRWWADIAVFDHIHGYFIAYSGVRNDTYEHVRKFAMN